MLDWERGRQKCLRCILVCGSLLIIDSLSVLCLPMWLQGNLETGIQRQSFQSGMGRRGGDRGRWQGPWGVSARVHQRRRTSRIYTLRGLSQEFIYMIQRSDWAHLKSVGQAVWKGGNSWTGAEAAVRSRISSSSGKPKLCSQGPSTDYIRPTQVLQDNPLSLKPTDEGL